ncbi:MAG: phosphatidate cytidylyltransferase [Hyphomicrobiaceae bacterium]
MSPSPRQTGEAAAPARTGTAPRSASRQTEMIVRMLSGAVLAVASIALVWGGTVWFAALVSLLAGIVAWEWGRMVRGFNFDGTMIIHVAAMPAAGGLTAAGLTLPAIIVLVVAALVIAVLSLRSLDRLSATGVLYVGLPLVALVWLRADEPDGLALIVFLFAVVWATDIFAFLVGRLVGGPRLWVRVSPGKTWSGALGGLVAAILAGLASGAALGGRPGWAMAAVAALLSIAAQAGDLLESALKRHSGVKDSSAIIPGHGGMFDRVDGLMAAAVVAALLAILIEPWRPGLALLGGGGG